MTMTRQDDEMEVEEMVSSPTLRGLSTECSGLVGGSAKLGYSVMWGAKAAMWRCNDKGLERTVRSIIRAGDDDDWAGEVLSRQVERRGDGIYSIIELVGL